MSGVQLKVFTLVCMGLMLFSMYGALEMRMRIIALESRICKDTTMRADGK